MCFHINRSKIKYLSTEKTSKNPRNSAYTYRIILSSVSGYQIECNCDDQKTGLTDDNVLRSMDQLPVTGNVPIVEMKT